MIAVLALLSVMVFADPIIVSSGPPLNGTFFNALSNNFVSGGSENSFTLDAQPFAAPDSSHVLLTSFSIYYVPNPGFPTNTLEAAVTEWNPANPSSAGSPLWTSTAGTTTAADSNVISISPTWGDWINYTFTTGGLTLDPTKTYALVVFQNATADAGDTESGLIAVSGTDGGAVFGARSLSATVDPGWPALDTSTWSASSNQIVYSTTFAQPVPEPATSAEIAGVLVFGLLSWRKRSRRPVSQASPSSVVP
ncbi:MAG: hypothetical protein P4L99_14025 [Chthoniobacter sp.]|nr:hypothetical protein [Chthoniobacter sp.]